MPKKNTYLKLEIPQKITAGLGQEKKYAKVLATFLNTGLTE